MGLQRETGDAKAELERQRKADAAARLQAERVARVGTFEQMLDAYVADLRARERVSATDVENPCHASHVLRSGGERMNGLCRTVGGTSGERSQALHPPSSLVDDPVVSIRHSR